MIWLISLLACGDKTQDSGTNETPPIDATLRLLSVNDGSPISGISVSAANSTDTINDDDAQRFLFHQILHIPLTQQTLILWTTYIRVQVEERLLR